MTEFCPTKFLITNCSTSIPPFVKSQATWVCIWRFSKNPAISLCCPVFPRLCLQIVDLVSLVYYCGLVFGINSVINGRRKALQIDGELTLHPHFFLIFYAQNKWNRFFSKFQSIILFNRLPERKNFYFVFAFVGVIVQKGATILYDFSKPQR